MDWQYLTAGQWGSMTAAEWETLVWVSPSHQSLSAKLQVMTPFQCSVTVTQLGAGATVEDTLEEPFTCSVQVSTVLTAGAGVDSPMMASIQFANGCEG